MFTLVLLFRLPLKLQSTTRLGLLAKSRLSFFRYRLSFSIFYLVISLNIVNELFFISFERLIASISKYSKELFFVIYFPKNSVLQLLMAVYLKD